MILQILLKIQIYFQKGQNFNLNFPLYIAKRYLFSKSSKNAINIISLITGFAILVGTISLFIVLSVFSGLKEFSTDFIRVSDPDLKITSSKGKSFFFTDSLSYVLNDKRIAHYSKVVEEKALFSYKEKQLIAIIKGVDANFLLVNNMDTAIYIGEWLDREYINSAVIGNSISSTLSLGTYDLVEPLKASVLRPGKGYINNPKTAFDQVSLQPLGIFKLTEELDSKYVFSNLELAQELLKYEPNKISAIELKISNGETEKDLVSYFENELGSNFKIQTRKQLNAVFYRMINTENIISYLVITLIVIIALFNVVGTILMVIIDKKENLKTLFSIGLTIKELRKIFVFQGVLLTFLGLIIGLIIAITFVLLQIKFGLIMITPSLAYPVEFKMFNVLIVVLTIMILGYVSAKIASSRISQNIIQ